MKIKGNSPSSLLFLIMAVMLSGSALFAQSSKKEDIRVPPEALKPAWTKDYFDDNLKNFKVWLASLAQLPAGGGEFKRRAREFGEISPSSVSLQLMNMRSIATNPDLEEVTKLPRSWYAQIYNAALPLQTAARTLVGMKVFCVEEDYQKARRIWINAVAETLALIDNPPKKLSKKKLDEIAAKNRERRKREYIKMYKARQSEGGAPRRKGSDKPGTNMETEEK